MFNNISPMLVSYDPSNLFLSESSTPMSMSLLHCDPRVPTDPSHPYILSHISIPFIFFMGDTDQGLVRLVHPFKLPYVCVFGFCFNC